MAVKFIYDGLSLPMIDGGNHIYDVQVLDSGRWRSLDSEEEYEQFFRDCGMFQDLTKAGAI